MTTLGLIGAGGIATAIATRAAAAGIDRITLSNSRGPESLRELAGRIGGSAVAGTPQAASEADIVVVSVPWSHVPEALGQVQSWAGRILIDTTNPIEAPAFMPFDLGGSTSSEIVASHAPGARVIKAFNTLNPTALGSSPQVGDGRRVIVFSGDDADAKAAVAKFVTALGFEAIELGSLRDGGRLHQFPGGPLAGRDLVQL